MQIIFITKSIISNNQSFLKNLETILLIPSVERLNILQSPQYLIDIAKMSRSVINLRIYRYWGIDDGGREEGWRIRNRPARRANLLRGCRRITRPLLVQVIILERSLMRLGEPGGLQRPEIVPPWPPRSSPARGPPSRKPCTQPHSLSRGQRGECAILPRPRHMRLPNAATHTSTWF